MKRGFRWLTGDVNWMDYGGKWIRCVGPARYHILSFDSWENMDSSAVELYGKYNCSLSEVDLGAIPYREISSALGCVGIDPDDLPDWVTPDNACEVMAEACHSYGCRAPLWDESGNNAHKLIRQAKAESRDLDDPREYARAMSRPVNAIGSTAAEFMCMDINSAILRGLANGDPRADLLAKLGVLRTQD